MLRRVVVGAVMAAVAATLLGGPAGAGGEEFDLKIRKHGAATYKGAGVFVTACNFGPGGTPVVKRTLAVGEEARFDLAVKNTGDGVDVVVDVAVSFNPQGVFKVRYFRNGENITDEFPAFLNLKPGKQKVIEVRIKVKSGNPGNLFQNCYRDNAGTDRVVAAVEVA